MALNTLIREQVNQQHCGSVFGILYYMAVMTTKSDIFINSYQEF